MTQTEVLDILAFPYEIESAVISALSKPGILKSAQKAYSGEPADLPILKYRSINRLASVVLLLSEKYDAYKTLGVPDEIIRETFRNVTLLAKLYYAKTGKAGITAEDALWLRHIMNINIFKIGSLQFQPFEMVYLDEELLGEPYMEFSSAQKEKLPSGAHVINCHIEYGADLSTEAVQASFAHAQAFFKEVYPTLEYKAFLCYSWLLYPDMLALLPDTSKIKSFAENFEIIAKVQDNEQAMENLFGKAYKRPPKPKNPTALQKLAAEQPEVFGFGCGVQYIR